ncbi:hypothetical protein AK812_SmicGene6143 [Symbiodinium microadriaticum]|uniref:Uncharacterized protein n=1 Tax=Symbiodinium microadriaticum TaxID=2951 RepID=A0A1Q9ES48_SYMMI|nr:hypothetical protein AK812_SmicGene6143 [Symbiodinium microadriaticum]
MEIGLGRDIGKLRWKWPPAVCSAVLNARIPLGNKASARLVQAEKLELQTEGIAALQQHVAGEPRKVAKGLLNLSSAWSCQVPAQTDCGNQPIAEGGREKDGPGPPRHSNGNGTEHGPMNPGTSNSATDVNHANAETSGIVSCDVHASSEAIRHLLILWLIWLFESFYISGFLCSALVLAVIMIRQEHAATRFWFCHTDRALMIWVCLSAVIQHGPLIAEAMQHKTAIRDHAGLSPLPGTRSGPAEKEYFGTRPLPTPCRNHLPRLSTSCSGERIIYEYEQKSQDCNIAPSNVWCLSIDDSHQCAGLGDEELGPLQTLLEESLAASDCPAMFLAHTLVETLVEHFAPQAPNTPIARPNVAWGPQPCRAALALEDLLPAQGPRRAHLWPRAFLFPAKGPILDEASPLHIASLSLGFSLDDARAFLAAETDLRDIQTLHACCLPHAMWSASALAALIVPLFAAGPVFSSIRTLIVYQLLLEHAILQHVCLTVHLPTLANVRAFLQQL